MAVLLADTRYAMVLRYASSFDYYLWGKLSGRGDVEFDFAQKYRIILSTYCAPTSGDT